MLGPVAGGSVRLSPIGDDGHLGIAEGIETALSAQAIFDMPTWAALSADGLRRWEWPHGVKRVTIFADAGDAGTQAAADLAERLKAAGIATRSCRRCMVTISTTIFGTACRRRTTQARRPLQPPTALTSRRGFRSRSLAGLTQAARSASAWAAVLGQLVQARLEPLPNGRCSRRSRAATRHSGCDPGQAGRRTAASAERDRRHPRSLSGRAGRASSGSTSPACRSATKPT